MSQKQLDIQTKYINQFHLDPENVASFKRIKVDTLPEKGRHKYRRFLNKIRKVTSFDAYDNLQVVKIPKMGYGVIATELIKKGSVVAVYLGEICSSIKANAHLVDNSYLFSLAGCGVPRFRKWLINAEQKGNIARFINHSSKQANLEPEVIMLHSPELGKPFPHVFLIALKDIKPGQQLFYDYGPDYWKNMGLKPVD